MGRKKKTEEQPKVEENVTNVKVNSNTSLKYEGKVQIQIQRGKRIISNTNKRNKGAQQMFTFLATCLSGRFVENLAPYYLVLLNHSGSNNTKLSNLIIKADVELNNNIVSYKFSIPSNAIISKTTCNRLALTNKASVNNFSSTITDINLDTYASAYIELTDDSIDLTNIKSNDSIIVIWSMEIKNKDGE